MLDAVRAVPATGVTIVWIEHVVHKLLSVAQIVVDFGGRIADGLPAARRHFRRLFRDVT